jgi:hypothetical protein
VRPENDGTWVRHPSKIGGLFLSISNTYPCILGSAAKQGPAQNIGFSFLLTGARGGFEGPRKAPLGYPWAFPGPPWASRRPPGPKTNQSKKPGNLKELTEQRSRTAPDLRKTNTCNSQNGPACPWSFRSKAQEISASHQRSTASCTRSKSDS